MQLLNYPEFRFITPLNAGPLTTNTNQSGNKTTETFKHLIGGSS